MPLSRKRAQYVRSILRQGPTEAGYAFFRARRRRRNRADADTDLLPSDRLVTSERFQVAAAHLDANAQVVAAQRAASATGIGTVRWFVPGFYLVWGGGVHTLLRFADHIARHHGVHNSFTVFDSDEARVVERVRAGIATAFPALAGSPVEPAGAEPAACDAAIATAWESVWPLVRFRRAPAKFVFLQDWEPDFYPAGSASAMLGEVPRLGIPAIANTAALGDAYRAEGGSAVSFQPAVDHDVFSPPISPRPDGPVRLVFYGRPRTPRNAFGLGLETLRRVKQRYGEGVEILCVGEDWDPGQYGVAAVLTNVGMLESLEAVADLYRSCDIGLVFMLTRHPSYQPLEFMACGTATVTNDNPYTSWLLEHEHTALVSPPLPDLVAAQIGRLVEDPMLRTRITSAGSERVAGTRWEDEFERVWRTITGELPFAEPLTDARRSVAPRG